MKRLWWTLVLLVSSPAWSFNTEHPRLMLNAQELNAIRAEVIQYPQSLRGRLYQNELKKNYDSVVGFLGTIGYFDFAALPSAALYAWIDTGGVRKGGNKVDLVIRSVVDRYAEEKNYADQGEFTYTSALYGIAISYDLLAPLMTSAERTKCRDKILRYIRISLAEEKTLEGKYIWTPKSADPVWGGTLDSFLYGNNHSVRILGAVGIGALALLDSNDEAIKAYLRTAYQYLVNLTETMIIDGSSFEGLHYGSYSLGVITLFAEGLRRGAPEFGNLYEYRPSYDKSYRSLEKLVSWYFQVLGNTSLSQRPGTFREKTRPMEFGQWQVDLPQQQMQTGVDTPIYLAPLIQYYRTPYGNWLYHQWVRSGDLSSIRRDPSSLFAFTVALDDQNLKRPPSVPQSYLGLNRGLYQYRAGLNSTDLQWGVEWRPTILPATGRYNWKHDVPGHRGAFLLSYGGADLIETAGWSWRGMNTRFKDKVQSECSSCGNSVLVDGRGHASFAYHSNSAFLKGFIEDAGLALVKLDLTPAYNWIVMEDRSRTPSGYKICSPQDLKNCQATMDYDAGSGTRSYTAKDFLNPVEYAQKTVFAVPETADSPAYFVTVDGVKKDAATHDYTLQFYTEADSDKRTDANASRWVLDASVADAQLEVYSPVKLELTRSAQFDDSRKTSISTASGNSFPISRVQLKARDVAGFFPVLWIPYTQGKPPFHVISRTSDQEFCVSWGLLFAKRDCFSVTAGGELVFRRDKRELSASVSSVLYRPVDFLVSDRTFYQVSGLQFDLRLAKGKKVPFTARVKGSELKVTLQTCADIDSVSLGGFSRVLDKISINGKTVPSSAGPTGSIRMNSPWYCPSLPLESIDRANPGPASPY